MTSPKTSPKTSLPGPRVFVVVAMAGVAVIGVALGMLLGPGGLALPGDEVLSLRAARVLLAFCVGASLSAVGAALQSLLRNPLADPFVLGISGGAAMGAALAVAVSSVGVGVGVVAMGGGAGLAVVTVGAIAGALAASALLVAFLGPWARSDDAILVGVITNAFSWAVVATIRALLPPADGAGLSVWLIGQLHYPQWSALLGVGVVSVVFVVLLLTRSGALTLLAGGDDDATRLGVDPDAIRRQVVVIASILVGTAVAVTGVIGFVGLVVPHLCRRALQTHRDRPTIIASVVVGGGALAGLDGVARGAFAVVGSELPVGALAALCGAPALTLFVIADRRAARQGHR
jgi:iron complex transport system permease protein